MAEKTTVYFFEKWDNIKGDYIRSRRPATLKGIEMAGGRVVSEGIEIDRKDLDGDEFMRRDHPSLQT